VYSSFTLLYLGIIVIVFSLSTNDFLHVRRRRRIEELTSQWFDVCLK